MRPFLRCSMAVAVVAAALSTAVGASAMPRSLGPTTRFYVPPPDAGAVQQVIDLLKKRDAIDALRVGALVAQGHAVWFTSGTPQQVQKQVRQTMEGAALERAVAVLVVYDVPFRDCGQYSAGGARNTADYLAWIDGVAKGIGNGKAVVIVEPDGLGLVPGQGCTPSAADLSAAGLTLAQAEQARYDQLNGAVDRPRAAVGRERVPRRHASGLAERRRFRVAARRSRCPACSGLLPERVELPVHRQRHVLRDVDLGLHRVCDTVGAGRLRVLPEPVLGRRSGDELGRRRTRHTRRLERPAVQRCALRPSLEHDRDRFALGGDAGQHGRRPRIS